MVLKLEKANVKIIDLNLPLVPLELYDPIQCKKSGKFIESTIICVHDLTKDVFVSAEIWHNGSFEKQMLS